MERIILNSCTDKDESRLLTPNSTLNNQSYENSPRSPSPKTTKSFGKNYPMIINCQMTHWTTEMNLYLGVWEGTRENRTGYWLWWWDEQGNLLLSGFKLAEQHRQRAERLAAQLRAAGIELQD